MFSLVNLVSWVSEILSSTRQEEDANEIKDESESDLPESQKIEHVPTKSMVDSAFEPPQLNNETAFQSDLILDCLRISDSEDWDDEIDSISTATFSSERSLEHNKNFHNPLTNNDNYYLGYDTTGNSAATNTVEDIKRNSSSCQLTSPSNISSQENRYFDEEVFPKASTQRISSSDKNTLSFQDHMYHEVTSKPHSQHAELYTETFPSCGQDYEHTNMWNEIISTDSKQMKNAGENKVSEIPFVKDETKIVSGEQSMANSENTFDYESTFQWDFMENLTLLEAVFTQDHQSKFLDMLKETLNCMPSPYSFLLYVVENHYSNVLEGKKSLAHVALTQFDKWRSEGLYANIFPAEMEKDRVLWIVTTRKLYLFDLCNKVFKLDSKGNEYLQRHIYYLLQSKNRYKEAVTIAWKLNLQPCFDPMEILFPLVILNKVQLAESYIANCPWQQRAFVSMLDKLCVMSDEQLDDLTSEIIIDKPSSNKVTQASLTKLGERIVKKFNLDPDDFPELFKSKNVKGLSYLLHQRQRDKGRSSSKKWDDLIERCVGDNSSLQQSLVDLLTEFGDKEEAKRWSRFYQLSSEKDSSLQQSHVQVNEENWENELENYDQGRQNDRNTNFSPSQPKKPLEEHYRASVRYLTLEIPMEKIYLVDDSESLRWCQRALSTPEVTIGFDAEWKPQMCQAGFAQRLSIVQLSLRDRVFILDVIALAQQVPESLLLAFANAVFANENVLKLGYGVESDFRALITTLPIVEKSIKKMKRFVDLCTLSHQLFEIPKIKKKVEKTTQSLTSFGHLSEKGLSLLVQQSLGLPLDKTYQLSDWEQRPLLTKQVEYAALDARCLIDVFDVLKKWMIEENIVIDLNKCSPRLPWLFPKRSRRAKTKLVKHPKPGTSSAELERLNEPAVSGSPNSPRNFRVVVDNMLQGLGRYLRCCGVDVVMLANEDDHDRAAKIARREDRVILTTGTPYYTLRSHVPVGHCMCVPAGSAKEQVLAVFKHFNIQVNTNDIFTRCQVCNGNEYIKVGSILMRQAYINYYEGIHEGHSAVVHSNPSQSPSILLQPLDVNTLYLSSGVKLKIEALPEAMLDKIELFYCCATCGKIFWEGGHFSRICAQFSDVLNNTGTLYQTDENPDLCS